MLSTVVGVITTILVASNLFQGLTPTVMDGIFAYGFIARPSAVSEPRRRDRGGRLARHHQSIVTDYVNQNAVIIIALVLLIVSLMIRPSGVFTKRSERRV